LLCSPGRHTSNLGQISLLGEKNPCEGKRRARARGALEHLPTPPLHSLNGSASGSSGASVRRSSAPCATSVSASHAKALRHVAQAARGRGNAVSSSSEGHSVPKHLEITHSAADLNPLTPDLLGHGVQPLLVLSPPTHGDAARLQVAASVPGLTGPRQLSHPYRHAAPAWILRQLRQGAHDDVRIVRWTAVPATVDLGAKGATLHHLPKRGNIGPRLPALIMGKAQ
jgi:hypothetical protein